jgi:Carboxypeptidase regulatory-like domain
MKAMRVMQGALLLCVAVLPCPAFACKCLVSQSVCHATASSEVVFIGTVVSVEPAFLDPWNVAQRPMLALLNQQSDSLRDEAAGGVAQLKQSLRKVFPDLPEYYRGQLEAAKSPRDLVSLFYAILSQGRRARIQVKSAFRGDEDEDDIVDVWTSFDDCGIDFQAGETYLVYADDDEESGRIETDRCTRTGRLTDAGADLAYLFFYRDNEDAGRLEGFVTFNAFYQRELDKLRDPERIASPVAEAVVELTSKKGSRYTTTDSGGRFLFDGLAQGTYKVSVYEKGYPATVRQIAGPKEVDISQKGCFNTVLVAAPPAAGRVP